MRKVVISVDEHYHLFNRGVHKQVVFHDRADYARFLFYILHFQSPLIFQNPSRFVSHFVRHSVFNIEPEIVAKIVAEREVELVAFCLMPNHFHLLVREVVEGGISRYMQRILNGYSKYHNTKRELSGHVFQGPYGAVHQEDNEQLLYLSTYIHRNPRELAKWTGAEHTYPWSSFQDCVTKNRWGDLLVPNILLEQFNSPQEYRKFVDSSPAKDFDNAAD